MTKPIEGWVVYLPDGSIETQEDSSDLMVTDEATARLYARCYADKRARPVRITFTDEPVINEKADLGMAFMAGAAWRKGDEVADEIRKERERIWGDVSIRSDIPPHVSAWLKLRIFGEEK